jgi:hypothetical protein
MAEQTERGDRGKIALVAGVANWYFGRDGQGLGDGSRGRPPGAA